MTLGSAVVGPHRARTDRGTSAPPRRVPISAPRRDRSAAAHRHGQHRQSVPGSARASPAKRCSPDWRVPSTRPRRAAADPPRRSGSRHWSRASAPAAPRGLAEALAAEQHADRALVAAPDPPAQLVELGEPEAVGMPSIIISVALGTSTPTSITVVATSTPARPLAKASITRPSPARFMRPWTRPTLISPKRA
jgi:hypothetical protein